MVVPVYGCCMYGVYVSGYVCMYVCGTMRLQVNTGRRGEEAKLKVAPAPNEGVVGVEQRGWGAIGEHPCNALSTAMARMSYLVNDVMSRLEQG